MEVTPYGFESFRLQGRTIDILINPVDGGKLGWKVPVVEPDLILLTSQKDYTDTSRARGEVMSFDRPGEYEFHGATIRGLPSGNTTVYLTELDDLQVVYLGELSEMPSDELLEEVSDADLLFVPVGGGELLSPKKATEVISQISPKVVVPTHYATPGLKLSGYEKLEAFLKEIGIKPRTDSRLKLTRRDLPEELELVVLEVS